MVFTHIIQPFTSQKPKADEMLMPCSHPRWIGEEHSITMLCSCSTNQTNQGNVPIRVVSTTEQNIEKVV